MVKAHNNKKDATSKLSINKFADMRPDEFGKTIQLPDNFYQIEKANPLHLNNLNQEVPKFIDWRDKDKEGPVYDQGKCQSCWAFTTSSTLASALAI